MGPPPCPSPAACCQPRPAIATTPSPPCALPWVAGFPPESYQLKYPAPGSPALADKVAALLQAAGVECRKDPKRGYDHGALVWPRCFCFCGEDTPLGFAVPSLRPCRPGQQHGLGCGLLGKRV